MLLALSRARSLLKTTVYRQIMVVDGMKKEKTDDTALNHGLPSSHCCKTPLILSICQDMLVSLFCSVYLSGDFARFHISALFFILTRLSLHISAIKRAKTIKIWAGGVFKN